MIKSQTYFSVNVQILLCLFPLFFFSFSLSWVIFFVFTHIVCSFCLILNIWFCWFVSTTTADRLTSTGGDRPKMHEQTGCFDPNTMGESVPFLKDNFPQTLPPSPIVVGNTTNSNNNSLEQNLRLSVEELSYNHYYPQHQEDHVSTYVSGVTATSIEIPHPQHLGLATITFQYKFNFTARYAPFIIVSFWV